MMNIMHPALRRLDLNLLPVFDAIYRHRSVRRAAKESAANAGGYAESASADAKKVAELADAVSKNAASAKESENIATNQAERSKREADRAEEAANRAESGLPVADVIGDQLGVSGNARKAFTKQT